MAMKRLVLLILFGSLFCCLECNSGDSRIPFKHVINPIISAPESRSVASAIGNTIMGFINRVGNFMMNVFTNIVYPVLKFFYPSLNISLPSTTPQTVPASPLTVPITSPEISPVTLPISVPSVVPSISSSTSTVSSTSSSTSNVTTISNVTTMPVMTCKNNGDKWANTDNCHQYFNCWYGDLEVKSCLLGTSWNCFANACMWGRKPECCEKNNPPKNNFNFCWANGKTWMDPYNASGYYKCVNHKRISQYCPSGQQYNRYSSKCA